MNWADETAVLIGHDAVQTWDAIWIVDNEVEVECLVRAGFPQTVAFQGSIDILLERHAEEFAKLSQVVLALAATPDGRRLRERIARRFGRHRCWLVEWPEGSDSASVTAALHMLPKVTEAVQAAYQYPIEGLQQISAAALHRLRHEQQPKTMTTGTRATDEILRLPTEGRLIVVTGWPGSGKTNWVRFVMIHTAAREERKWLVFSPEMSPWEFFCAECAQVYFRKPFWPTQGRSGLTDGEIGEAGRWLRERVVMQVCDAESQAPTLEWLLEGAGDAVRRFGITDWCIDPVNEVAQERGNLTEAEYLNRFLQRLKSFANRYGVNVWLIVHPKTPIAAKPGEERGPPGPYDINGGAAWFNKADLGITVHSRVPGSAQVKLWKLKFLRYGARGGVKDLLFDPATGFYSDIEPEAGLSL